MMVLETGPGTTADVPHRSVLIVGAGIAGMGTALLLAEAGYAVYWRTTRRGSAARCTCWIALSPPTRAASA